MADLALLVLTLFWGTTFHFVKGVLAVASPGVFLAARFARRRGGPRRGGARAARPRRRRGSCATALLLGLFMLGGFVLQTLGLRHTTPARSGFLTGLAVLIVPFLARFLLGRRGEDRALGRRRARGGRARAAHAALRRAAIDARGPARRPPHRRLRRRASRSRSSTRRSGRRGTRSSPLALAQVAVTLARRARCSLPFEARCFDAGGAAAFAGTVAFTGRRS